MNLQIAIFFFFKNYICYSIFFVFTVFIVFIYYIHILNRKEMIKF